MRGVCRECNGSGIRSAYDHKHKAMFRESCTVCGRTGLANDFRDLERVALSVEHVFYEDKEFFHVPKRSSFRILEENEPRHMQ